MSITLSTYIKSVRSPHTFRKPEMSVIPDSIWIKRYLLYASNVLTKRDALDKVINL